MGIKIAVNTGIAIDNALLNLAITIFHKVTGLAVASVRLSLHDVNQPAETQKVVLSIVDSTSSQISAKLEAFSTLASSSQATVNLDPTTHDTVVDALKSSLALTTIQINAYTLAGQQALSSLLAGKASNSTLGSIHAAVASIGSAGHTTIKGIYSPPTTPVKPSRLVKRAVDIAGLLTSTAGQAIPLAGASLAVKFSMTGNIDLLLELNGQYNAGFTQTLLEVAVPGFSIPNVSLVQPQDLSRAEPLS